MSTILAQTEVRHPEIVAEILGSGEAAATAIPATVMGVPVLSYSNDVLAAPASLPVPQENQGIIGKVLGLLRILWRKPEAPEYWNPREIPAENPYDRAGSGHMMVRL